MPYTQDVQRRMAADFIRNFRRGLNQARTDAHPPWGITDMRISKSVRAVQFGMCARGWYSKWVFSNVLA